MTASLNILVLSVLWHTAFAATESLICTALDGNIPTLGCGNTCNCPNEQSCGNQDFCEWKVDAATNMGRCERVVNPDSCSTRGDGSCYILHDQNAMTQAACQALGAGYVFVDGPGNSGNGHCYRSGSASECSCNCEAGCTALSNSDKGCGHSCNCPNSTSCAAGAAKYGCKWSLVNNRCESIVKSDCANKAPPGQCWVYQPDPADTCASPCKSGVDTSGEHYCVCHTPGECSCNCDATCPVKWDSILPGADGKGCGNGCNCPNEQSCTHGVPKAICSWQNDDFGGHCSRRVAQSECTPGRTCWVHRSVSDSNACVANEAKWLNCQWTGATGCYCETQDETDCACQCGTPPPPPSPSPSPPPPPPPPHTNTPTLSGTPSVTPSVTPSPTKSPSVTKTPTVTSTSTELTTCFWPPSDEPGCETNCNCRTPQACLNQDGCGWTGLGCTRLKHNTRCSSHSSEVCAAFERRHGGCGNTCNCPNQISCETYGKDMCTWTEDGYCKRLIPEQSCTQIAIGDTTTVCYIMDNRGCGGGSCDCPTETSCNAGGKYCHWEPESTVSGTTIPAHCIREAVGPECDCNCGAAVGKFCRAYENRLGGCGWTCNCPNKTSCESGLAKDQCQWDGHTGICYRLTTTKTCDDTLDLRTCYIPENRMGGTVCKGTCANCGGEANCNAAAAKCAWIADASAAGGGRCVRKMVGSECNCNCNMDVCYVPEFREGTCADGENCNCPDIASCTHPSKNGKCAWSGSRCVIHIADHDQCHCKCALPTCENFHCDDYGQTRIENPENMKCTSGMCDPTVCCNRASSTASKVTCKNYQCESGSKRKQFASHIRCKTKCEKADCCRTTNTCEKYKCRYGYVSLGAAKTCNAKTCKRTECCKKTATCNKFTCDANTKLKTHPGHITCAENPCTNAECCVATKSKKN